MNLRKKDSNSADDIGGLATTITLNEALIQPPDWAKKLRDDSGMRAFRALRPFMRLLDPC